MHRFEDVSRPDRGSQAIDDIVGLLQHFFLGAEAAHNNHRTKHFTLDNLCVVAVLSNNGWLEEEALLQSWNAGTLTASYDVCARSQGTFDKALDGGTLGGGDQWPHVGALVCRVADTNLLDLAEERVHE